MLVPLIVDAELLNTDAELAEQVSVWMSMRSEFIRELWSNPSSQLKMDALTCPSDSADEIAKVLTSRVFNYQSKRHVSGIIPDVRQHLFRQINSGSAIKIFLLYNGGYRSSPLPNRLSLIFEPDQTELMLLYQIALLNKKIRAIYHHGVEFSIVINNGVAKWVNEIPIVATENYANQLRRMIACFGAENSIGVLLQSEMVGFDPGFSFDPFQSQTSMADDEHCIVERFLGRSCSREEAEYRAALYTLAEAKWAEDLSPVIAANDGIVMRQIAHPDMLSFRPFPGGAIRIQNGTFGFQYLNNTLRPKLITSKSWKEYEVKWIACPSPWCYGENINAFKNE